MIRHLFVSSRPLSWINTAFPFGAAYLLTTGRIDIAFLVGVVYFLIPYNLAMYGINDVFDYESDLRNPRKGGVEGAVLAKELHRPTLVAVAVTNIPFLIVLVALGRPMSWLVLAVSLFAVVAYSAPVLRFKERPVLDSITSSTHFVSPAVYGLVLGGADFTPALVALLAAYSLWGMASHAFGAVQDIGADREAHIASIATVFGAAVTSRLALLGYTFAGVLLLFADWPGPLAAVLAIPYVLMSAPFVRLRDEDAEQANKGWRFFLAINFVVGFLATLLLIVYVLI